jgi:TonB-dependent receptor
MAMAQSTGAQGNGQNASAANDSAPASASDIVVTGYRASLARADQMKRNASVVMDSISAEDIGKFPDANIADALQRVTGVQISQNAGGEGRYISIRGLGSQYNVTTYNGRVLATDGSGRDFSYDVLPAEILGSASVYKTSSADMVEGSIGGSVELATINPLSHKGLHFAGSVGAYDDTASKKVDPRASIAISDTFADNTLGVLFGFSYYKRHWRSDTYTNLGTPSAEYVAVSGSQASACSPSMTYATPCTASGKAAYPGVVGYLANSGVRERYTFAGAIEWQPSDRIHSKIDGYYTHYKDPQNGYTFNINLYENNGWGRFNGTVVPWPGPGADKYMLSSVNLTNIGFELGTNNSSRNVDTYEIGWNTEYKVSDRFSAVLDIAYSDSELPNTGQNNFTVAGTNGADISMTLTPTAPVVTCTLESTNSSCFNLPNNQIGLHYMNQTGDTIKDHAFSSRLDFTYKFGQVGPLDLDLKFGGFFSQRIKEDDNYQSANGCGYCNNFSQTLGAVGVNAVVPWPYGSGFQIGGVGSNGMWQTLSAQQLFAAAIATSGQAYFNSTIAAQFTPFASSHVRERVSGGYVQARFKGGKLDGNVGLRYVNTSDFVQGWNQPLLSLTQIPNSTNYSATFGSVTPVSATSSYGNWLPSANLTYHLQRNLQLRLAASRSITRPSFNQLGLNMSYNYGSPPLTETQNGNPYLKAITSDAADVSLEWYAGKGISASAAGFYKHVSGFVGSAQFPATVGGLPGALYQPVNASSAKLGGVELAVKYTHPSGFGVLGNYTFATTDGHILLPDGSTVNRGLDGVSKNTYNVSGFYEKGRAALRVSYTYRGKYISNSLGGPDNTPVTTASVGTMDISASYNVFDHSSIYFNVSNALGSAQHQYVYNPIYSLYYAKTPHAWNSASGLPSDLG